MTSGELAVDHAFGPADDELEQALDVTRFNRESVYNRPGFKPSHTELSHAPVQVVGELPADLEGVYVRNGTNPQFADQRVRYHMFDGAAMLHQVQILRGEATYSNTYIRTPRFNIERELGRETYSHFSDLAVSGDLGMRRMQLIAQKQQKGLIPTLSGFETTGASTSVQYHGGHLYGLQEFGHPFRVNARVESGRLMLDGTGEFETWGGGWEGPFSAHARLDPDTGDFYNVSIEPGGGIYVGHVSNGIAQRQTLAHQQDGEKGAMVYLHDFFVTQNHLVFPDISLRSNPLGKHNADGSLFDFRDDYTMRWGVLPRDFKPGDTARWFDTGIPGSLWHAVSGWEETDGSGRTSIVIFAPKFAEYPCQIPIHTPAEATPRLTKWVLDLDTGTVTDERTLLDHAYERPSINLDYLGRPNRYAYLLDEERDGYMGKGVLKYDLSHEEEVDYFDYGDLYGGEPLFVSKENPSSEDDGYLLDLLMGDDNASLVVIDASTMLEVARLVLPQRVPFGVHACWLDTERLDVMAALA